MDIYEIVWVDYHIVLPLLFTQPFSPPNITMSDPTISSEQPTAEQPPRWQPLSATDRRVAGVLVEKAKTTPEVYPMSLNGICTACNQKSNRAPVMQLEQDQVFESLDRLRHMGAVGLIEGVGRVDKYRHYLYEWLGVDKVELAVMAELLLRGDQTEGDLRLRASRMEPIADLPALRAVLDSLQGKGLIISLTPEGRGHVISHALYKPAELDRLKERYAASRTGVPVAATDESEPTARAVAPAETEASHQEMEEMRIRMAQMASEIEELKVGLQQVTDDLYRLKSALGN